MINSFSSSRYGAINKDFDYSYIDGCATPGRVYDVNTKEALESTLDAIADDIKTWAGYEKAKIVATKDIPAESGGFF